MNTDKNFSNGYRKVYKMRLVGENGLTIAVALPKPVVEKAARERGLSIAEFVNKFRAVATYDGFDGVHYSFEEVKES